MEANLNISPSRNDHLQPYKATDHSERIPSSSTSSHENYDSTAKHQAFYTNLGITSPLKVRSDSFLSSPTNDSDDSQTFARITMPCIDIRQLIHLKAPQLEAEINQRLLRDDMCFSDPTDDNESSLAEVSVSERRLIPPTWNEKRSAANIRAAALKEKRLCKILRSRILKERPKSSSQKPEKSANTLERLERIRKKAADLSQKTADEAELKRRWNELKDERKAKIAGELKKEKLRENQVKAKVVSLRVNQAKIDNQLRIDLIIEKIKKRETTLHRFKNPETEQRRQKREISKLDFEGKIQKIKTSQREPKNETIKPEKTSHGESTWRQRLENLTLPDPVKFHKTRKDPQGDDISKYLRLHAH